MAGAFISGVVGQIKWHHYVAAAVNNYAVGHADGTWRLRATVVLSDAFKLSQRPLTFVAPHAKGEWRWPIETFEIAGGAMTGELTARLGPPEA